MGKKKKPHFDKTKKGRGTWERKPETKVKESAKGYDRKKEKAEKNWELEDFVDSVHSAMEDQEKENPAIRHVHARLSPEWKIASEKIGKLLTETDEGKIEKLREEVVEEGEIAVRVLIDFLLSVKRKAKKENR